MTSRRGAVKFNPVTGKMEKADPLPAGKHRDGCMLVDDRYVNAAKDLGMGAEKGMYAHIKGLAKMDAADVPVGTSMETETRGRGASSAPVAATGWGAKGGDLLKAAPSAIASAVAEGAMRTMAKNVGGNTNVHGFVGTSGTAGKSVAEGSLHSGAKDLGGNTNVHGFRSSTSKAPAAHNHEDSFQRRKGVVNTVGGAKDVTRASKEEPARLPAKGERKGAQIMGLDLLDAHTVEGKAKREGIARREAAGGGFKPTAVHVSGGGGRAGGGGASARYGGLQPSMGIAPVKELPKASRLTGTVKIEGAHGVLGGASSAANAAAGGGGIASAGAMGDREKRAAHFEKILAAQDAARKAAAERTGMAGSVM